MLEILLTNGEMKTWNNDQYTDYAVKGRFFIVINNNQWVGMYGLDQIVSMECRE